MRTVGRSKTIGTGIASGSDEGTFNDFARIDHRHRLFGPWTTIPFNTSWSQIPGFRSFQYATADNLVALIGSALTTDYTLDTGPVALPIHIRPKYAQQFRAVTYRAADLNNSVFGGLEIKPDGSTKCMYGQITVGAFWGTNFRIHAYSILYRID